MMELSLSDTKTLSNLSRRRPSTRAQAVLAAHQRLGNDLELCARACLRIRPYQGGAAMPFIFNRAQQILHARLERQLAETGRVRALVLKSRRMGISTYVGARFYHRATWRKGI